MSFFKRKKPALSKIRIVIESIDNAKFYMDDKQILGVKDFVLEGYAGEYCRLTLGIVVAKADVILDRSSVDMTKLGRPAKKQHGKPQ
jgi:hypothetical protein